MNMLMTKFGKAGKPVYSNFWFRTTRFWQFQNRIKEEAKHEDLRIQVCLRHEKEKQGIKGLKQKKFKPKGEVTKNWTIWCGIPDYPVCLEQIESNYGLIFSLFWKDSLIYVSKSYVMQLIYT
jgi:hypothetical protein